MRTGMTDTEHQDATRILRSMIQALRDNNDPSTG